MRHHFQHDFDDNPPLSDFEMNLDAPAGAFIRFDWGDDGLWISANRAGWIHLARVCAEMGLHSQFKPGYHFHRSKDWIDMSGDKPEVSFELGRE